MMFWRTKPKIHSRADWPRPGMIFMLRVPSQNTTMMISDDEDADEHHAVELEGRAFEQQDRREELFDRRAVEAAIVIARGGVGDQGCDVGKQWRLRLRGADMSRCDDGT